MIFHSKESIRPKFEKKIKMRLVEESSNSLTSSNDKMHDIVIDLNIYIRNSITKATDVSLVSIQCHHFVGYWIPNVYISWLLMKPPSIIICRYSSIYPQKIKIQIKSSLDITRNWNWINQCLHNKLVPAEWLPDFILLTILPRYHLVPNFTLFT